MNIDCLSQLLAEYRWNNAFFCMNCKQNFTFPKFLKSFSFILQGFMFYGFKFILIKIYEQQPVERNLKGKINATLIAKRKILFSSIIKCCAQPCTHKNKCHHSLFRSSNNNEKMDVACLNHVYWWKAIQSGEEQFEKAYLL